jgi:hypothetical protein
MPKFDVRKCSSVRMRPIGNCEVLLASETESKLVPSCPCVHYCSSLRFPFRTYALVRASLLLHFPVYEETFQRASSPSNESCHKPEKLIILLINIEFDLYGLVVRIPGYRSRGFGSIPSATIFSEK